MAKAKVSVLLRTLEGKVGGTVFKKQKGTNYLIVSQAPEMPEGATVNQKAQRAVFNKGVNFARAHINDAEYIEAASGTPTSSWNQAIKDACKDPEILSTNHFTYDDSLETYDTPPIDPADADPDDKYAVYYIPSSPTVDENSTTVKIFWQETDAEGDDLTGAPVDVTASIAHVIEAKPFPNGEDNELRFSVELEDMNDYEVAASKTGVFWLQAIIVNRANRKATFEGIHRSGDDVGHIDYLGFVLKVQNSIDYIEKEIGSEM